MVACRSGVLTIAHCGDCRAVLGTAGEDGGTVAVELTQDHNLQQPEEVAAPRR